MNPERDITEIMDVPAFVPEKLNAAKLLKNFQQQKRQLAVVVDEFGGTEGLVTVEDIVEEIVGEVADEYDTGTMLFEELAPNRYAVSGRMRIGLEFMAHAANQVVIVKINATEVARHPIEKVGQFESIDLYTEIPPGAEIRIAGRLQLPLRKSLYPL